MADVRIVVLEGDQTGQELLEAALRVLAPDVIGLEIELDRFDLSLENRRRTRNKVCTEAARAMMRGRAEGRRVGWASGSRPRRSPQRAPTTSAVPIA